MPEKFLNSCRINLLILKQYYDVVFCGSLVSTMLFVLFCKLMHNWHCMYSVNQTFFAVISIIWICCLSTSFFSIKIWKLFKIFFFFKYMLSKLWVLKKIAKELFAILNFASFLCFDAETCDDFLFFWTNIFIVVKFRCYFNLNLVCSSSSLL